MFASTQGMPGLFGVYHPPGTSLFPFVSVQERETNSTAAYQTISFQSQYQNYSLEEHRLADYQKGLSVGRPAPIFSQPSTVQIGSMFSACKDIVSASRRDQSHLHLLRGPAIQVCVGSDTCQCKSSDLATCECDNTWFLPKALISYYSPFLKAACMHNFKEKGENRIKLPQDDPATFALYVEWLYYGSYTRPTRNIFSDDGNADARCWVLGDKFLDVRLKNHAMSRIYAEYTSTSLFSGSAVTPCELQYVLENTAKDSKIRQFYIAFVVQNYTDQTKVRGTAEKWDEVLECYADARVMLLRSFRSGSTREVFVKTEKEYMDRDASLFSETQKLSELKIESDEL